MRLSDGRTVHDSGYCWICGDPRLSIDDRTCRRITCETEHAKRIALPTVHRLDPLPRAFASFVSYAFCCMLEKMTDDSRDEIDAALRALGKPDGYTECTTVLWLNDFIEGSRRK